MAERTPLEELRRKVQITKDARFQAHLRLERRSYFSPYLIALLSLYVIAISFFPTVFDLSQKESQLLFGCVVVVSIFIIILSLNEASRNFYHRGKLLHENAVKLGPIFDTLELLREDDAELVQKVDGLSKEYAKVIEECPVNHENVDYLHVVYTKHWMFKYRYAEYKFAKYFQRLFLGLRVLISEYAWSFLPFLVVGAVTVVLWKISIGGFSPLSFGG